MKDPRNILEIKRALDKLERAKINAERYRQGLGAILTWEERCNEAICGTIREKIIDKCCYWCVYDRDRHRRIPRFALCTDGTYQNTVMKNCFGFISGLFLTLLWFLLMFYQLNYRAKTCLVVCSILGVVLSLGLAFSYLVRCIVLIMLPSLFSSKGRAVLLTFAMVLVMNSPMQNYRINVDRVSASMTCGQEFARNTTRDLVEAALNPVQGMISTIREITQSLIDLAERLRNAFIWVRNIFQQVFGAIQNVFDWLDGMVTVCNEKMGEPYSKCTAAFDKAYDDCEAAFAKGLEIVCKVLNWFDWVCELIKLAELLCNLQEMISNFVTENITAHVKMAINNVYEMFYFRITINYKYNIIMEQSKSFKEVREEIQKEVRQRLGYLMTVFRMSNIITIIMFIWLVGKALLYRYKYLTKDNFDNHYITYNIRDIDERREELMKEIILPIKGMDKWRYIKCTSFRMSKHEIKSFLFGFIMFAGGGIHAGLYIALDYCTYWVLVMVRKHGSVSYKPGVPSHYKMHVVGEGIIADLYRSVITKFDPMATAHFNTDTGVCLPVASEPDWRIYKIIAYIYVFCFFTLIFQAYGLRLRHIFAGKYYPEREKERAVWLYMHILKRRASFLKHFRRSVRREHEKRKQEERFGFLALLGAKCPCFNKILRLFGIKYKYCLGCGLAVDADDNKTLIKCVQAKCRAVYCKQCFEELENLCTACMEPVEYGDYSDISEEKDSTGEEYTDSNEEQDNDENKAADMSKYKDWKELMAGTCKK